LNSYVGKKGNIQIYNNLGQQVFELDLEEIPDEAVRLDLSGLNNGLYHISVKVENYKRTSSPFVISKL